MKLRPWCALVVVYLLFAQPLFAQNLKLPLPVPDGTRVSPIKYGDSETAVELKPQEQVALRALAPTSGTTRAARI
jgi:hypothetical protein